jgi:hypothetical protein
VGKNREKEKACNRQKWAKWVRLIPEKGKSRVTAMFAINLEYWPK